MSIKTMILGLAAAITMSVASLGFVPNETAYAACTNAKDCAKTGVTGAGGDASNGSIGPILRNITNTLLFLLGAVAVIMIVIGGFKYVISNGDTSQVTSAKNTIFYAVIGLVVALLAYAIVNFVNTKL